MIDSGCFGHVCPPWFAPQFPLVSSSNVEAVAANSVALQHYGQKVVHGYVMTNSGKRFLIQISFDVMNVRKPLLGTSALKHSGQPCLTFVETRSGESAPCAPGKVVMRT